MESHPTWVRGLKCPLREQRLAAEQSHPTWVRGLKCALFIGSKIHGNVAPHVGAWIEIRRSAPSISLANVAPHVGAWIEIHIIRPSCR